MQSALNQYTQVKIFFCFLYTNLPVEQMRNVTHYIVNQPYVTLSTH
jgi:hypothetical protein